jgi:ABC-type transport system involved in multi-copper enzyme maturation permease subunit
VISPDSTAATLQRAELAPSEVRADSLTFVRIAGAAGLAALLLGLITLVVNDYGPRFVGKAGGYAFALAGCALLVYHAIRDGDIEFRRAYTFFSYALLALFAITGIAILSMGETQTVASRFKGVPVFADGGSLLTVFLGLFGLAFLTAPLRHETNPQQRAVSLLVLLGFGAALCLGAVVLGLAVKDLLVGPGIVMALLGVGFLSAFFTHAGSSEGLGHIVALLLGAAGAVAIAYGLGKSIWPTVLHDGPSALKNALQANDTWKVLARVAAIMLCLGLAGWAWRAKQATVITRGLAATIGLSFAAVFIYGSFAQALPESPKQYLVPFGIILTFIGLVFLAVSTAHVSESPLVTLSLREVSSFFVSPIVYFILFGCAIVAGIGHLFFLAAITGGGADEPIVQNDSALLNFAAFTVLFMVPALTMRTFSEEKRTGTLEVLLTSPVSEFSIVFSKFLAAWFVYLLTFLPAMLLLVALRAEGGPFDYRPLLSHILAVGVSGMAFIGMGLFFSSLTPNQIVAAMLTFVGMFSMLLTIVLRRMNDIFGDSFLNFVSKFDFLSLWSTSLQGQVSVSQCAVFASLGVFWLFLNTKVLEARKWG